MLSETTWHLCSVILADKWASLNLNTQTHQFSFFSVLITSPNWFFSVMILVGSSGNQNRVPAPPGSKETPCCMSTTDAYYWFTLWPRKQLIVYAEAAWHLTIRCGERDDWMAHISIMEDPLHVFVCASVWLLAHTLFSVSSLPRSNVADLIWLFSTEICIDSLLPQVLLLFIQVFMLSTDHFLTLES